MTVSEVATFSDCVRVVAERITNDATELCERGMGSDLVLFSSGETGQILSALRSLSGNLVCHQLIKHSLGK